jgi:hypothetical protein
MRAAAVAFVLVVGAAVVLWFGNTLNSWVLGGLIGGLAALLLSIPISLSLFSFLSRRHDERFRAEMQTQISLGQTYEYPRLPAGRYERRRGEQPALLAYRSRQDDEAIYEQDDYEEEYQEAEEFTEPADLPSSYGERALSRRSASLSHSSRLSSPLSREAPASSASMSLRPRQSPLSPTPAAPRPEEPRKQPPRLTPAHLRSASLYPGLPRTQSSLRHSQYLSEALRAARLEAARRQSSQLSEEDIEVSPMLPPPPPGRMARRSAGLHPSSSLQARQRPLTPSEELATDGLAIRSRSTAPGEAAASLDEDAPAARRPLRRDLRRSEEEDLWEEPPGPTSARPARQSPGAESLPPRAGSLGQTHTTGEQRRLRGLPSGSLKNPLVRRPPYLYEDDPLREELARQLDGPITRRSSLYRRASSAEEEQL